MAIAKELLKLLVCPVCRGQLELTAASDGIDCPKCAVRYPIRDDIAMLVAEEARRIEKGADSGSH